MTSTIYELNFGVLVLYSALSGLAVLGGGAIFSLMSEKYPDSLAPAAIGYSEVFGILASFAAPWSMGAVIQASGGSFAAAFVLFALVEAVVPGAPDGAGARHRQPADGHRHACRIGRTRGRFA